MNGNRDGQPPHYRELRRVMPRGRLFGRLDEVVLSNLRARIFPQFSTFHDHGQIGLVLDKRYVRRWIAAHQKQVGLESFFDPAALLAKSHEFGPDGRRAT